MVVLLVAPVPAAGATRGTLTITSDTRLTANHHGSIIVDADGITLDCDGHTVSGPDLERGISIEGHDGVTVANCRVTGFPLGIVLLDSSGNALRANSVSSTLGSGIIVDANHNRVVGNRTSDTGNNGIESYFCSGNVFKDNVATGSRGSGLIFVDIANSSIVGNTSRGSGAIGISVAESRDVVVRRNVARETFIAGIVLRSSSATTLRGNRAVANVGDGFRVWRADGNVLIGNGSIANGAEGFRLGRSHHNLITGSAARFNGESGFLVFASDGNTFRSNDASHNHRARRAEGAGFETSRSDGNRFVANRAVANQDGFVLWNHSSHNTFEGNIACDNEAWDAYDNRTGAGNVWVANTFCTDNLEAARP